MRRVRGRKQGQPWRAQRPQGPGQEDVPARCSESARICTCSFLSFPLLASCPKRHPSPSRPPSNAGNYIFTSLNECTYLCDLNSRERQTEIVPTTAGARPGQSPELATLLRGGRIPTTGAYSYCLPGCALTRRQDQGWSQSWNPGSWLCHVGILVPLPSTRF